MVIELGYKSVNRALRTAFQLNESSGQQTNEPYVPRITLSEKDILMG
jgi:hypothetical protein